jgi:hypothetical protein
MSSVGGSGPAGGSAGASGRRQSGLRQAYAGGRAAVVPRSRARIVRSGSLREALSASGPRIIVFEVGGIIDLGKTRLDVNEPFVTVAGQTAPSPGVTIIRGGMRVFSHDVKIEHVRFRMGDAGDAAPSGFEPDVTTDGASAYNVVFDHVSVAWGVDENLSVSGPRLDGAQATSHNVTISNSIIAEGLNNSVHEKGSHSMGTLIHDYCTNIAVVGNLYAHNDEQSLVQGLCDRRRRQQRHLRSGRAGQFAWDRSSEWSTVSNVPEGPRVSVVGNVMHHGTIAPRRASLVGHRTLAAALYPKTTSPSTRPAPP